MNGCATTSKIKEPTSPDSTLLVGRIRLDVTGFAGGFQVLNGWYTEQIEVYLVNALTEELITVKSHGSKGLFYITDLEPGVYLIAGFEKFINEQYRGIPLPVTLGYPILDHPHFYVTDGCVNNLSDIEWRARFVEGQTWIDSKADSWHLFINNYQIVEEWLGSTYPESEWNNMIWIDVEILTTEE